MVGASLFQLFVNEIAMSNVSGPNSAKSNQQVESQKRWMVRYIAMLSEFSEAQMQPLVASFSNQLKRLGWLLHATGNTRSRRTNAS